MSMNFTFEPDPELPFEQLVYTFGGHEPVAEIRPGQVVSTWTRDAFNGAISNTDQVSSTQLDARFLNPQTGPFYVAGAEPGDTLAVHFHDIEPRESWGVSTTVPFFGSLTTTPRTAGLQAALAEQTWIYAIDREARLVRYAARESALTLDLPLDPMHGTVGVAPPLGEARSSLAPGSWGGNMDTPELRAGTTCYFGVNVPGALLCLGDGHARQGEGETCGVAVETAMDTTFSVDLIKGVPTPWPRLETDDFIMTVGSSRPLEDAFRIAHADLVTWVAELLSLSLLDAYQLVTQTALSPIANVVDVDYSVVAKLSKSLLPAISAYGDMHDRMRARPQAPTN